MQRARVGIGQQLVVAALAAVSCDFGVEPDRRPQGAPLIQSFGAVDATGPVALTDMMGAPVPISPRVAFVARFDRLLDGAALEDTSGAMPVGLPGIATVTWQGGPPAAQVAAAVSYVPNGHEKFHLIYPPGPQLLVLVMPTLPAGVPVTISLDRTRLRSKEGQGPATAAAGVNEPLSFTTLPFAVTFLPAAMSLPENQRIQIQFSNLPAADAPTKVTVVVSDAAGMALPGAATVEPDPTDPALFTVTRAIVWPAGGRVDVAIDATTTDALGTPITGALAARFSIPP